MMKKTKKSSYNKWNNKQVFEIPNQIHTNYREWYSLAIIRPKEKDKANGNRAFETMNLKAFAFRTLNRRHH